MLSHTLYGYSLSARKQAQVHTSDKNISTGLLAGLLVEDDPSMVGWGGGRVCSSQYRQQSHGGQPMLAGLLVVEL